MKTIIALLIWSLLAVTPAEAGNWRAACSNPAGADVPLNNTGNNQSRCHVPVTGDLDSVVLSTDQCENIDAIYFDDASTTTCQILSCMTAACTESFIVENKTLDGNEATGTEAIYGFAARFVKADCTTNPAAGTPGLLLRCNH